MRNQTPYSQFCAFPFPSHFANLADIPCAHGCTLQVALGEVCYEHTHIESLFSLFLSLKRVFWVKRETRVNRYGTEDICGLEPLNNPK
jgi:hypothetical protein